MMILRRRFRTGAEIALLLLAARCGAPKDPVRATVDAMVRAANARDAKALFDRVASGFSAADGSGRAEARATVERYFAAYETLSVSIGDLRIERGADAARVRFRAAMSGRPRRIGGLDGLVPSSAAYDFDVRLSPEDGTWKVTWAGWNPAGEGGRNE
ncbi:MAG: nuclear transport factor 2 family protein [Syntrophomonadaceae bacterium]